MKKLTVTKLGGSTVGIRGEHIPRIIERIRELRATDTKVVAVFSAPLVQYEGERLSLTDLALRLGRDAADAKPVEARVLSEVYEEIAAKHMSDASRREFLGVLEEFYARVSAGLREAKENRRFADVTRARVLAYSGEYAMASAMHHILKSHGIDASWVSPSTAPVITDECHDGASFLLEESKQACGPFLAAVAAHDVTSVAGFIGRTTLGLETTFGRGGSDRTAVAIAILLREHYDVRVGFEKDSAVLSADPRIDRRGLELVRELSYAEAKDAALFGMKILDPFAIRELEEIDAEIPLVVSDINDPKSATEIRRSSTTSGVSPIKIVTGRRNCAIVRMENTAASHLVASLTREKRYFEFVQLSQYRRGEELVARLLFLDGDFVAKNEKYVRSYDRRAEIVRGRGVVTVIGEEMWKIPTLVSLVSGAIGSRGIRIANIDFQEETCRLLIIVDDDSDNVANAIRAIHGRRRSDV